MNRRSFLHLAAAAGAHGIVGARAEVGAAAPAVAPTEFTYASVAELRMAMDSEKATAASLAEQFLARIDAIDRAGPALSSVIETNPDAAAIARALDEERKAKGPRGPLHGVPVLVKDNLDTADK